MADEINQTPESNNEAPQPVVPEPVQQAAPVTSKKTSGLAVGGLVLGILAILGAWIPLLNLVSLPLALVGLALAIAGLVVVNKGNHGGKGIAIAALVLTILSLVLIFGMYGAASSSSSKTAATGSRSAATSTAASSAATVADDKSEEAANREYEVTVDGVRTGTDYSGNPVVIVTYSWVNNSQKTESFATVAHATVFQNGVECELGVGSGSDSSGYMADVKPGAGTSFELAYKTTDESDITIEIGPFINFNDEVWYEGTFQFA